MLDLFVTVVWGAVVGVALLIGYARGRSDAGWRDGARDRRGAPVTLDLAGRQTAWRPPPPIHTRAGGTHG